MRIKDLVRFLYPYLAVKNDDYRVPALGYQMRVRFSIIDFEVCEEGGCARWHWSVYAEDAAGNHFGNDVAVAEGPEF